MKGGEGGLVSFPLGLLFKNILEMRGERGGLLSFPLGLFFKNILEMRARGAYALFN